MAKKPTVKEQKLVNNIAKGMTKTDAYRDAYDTQGNNNTVSVEASRTLNKPHVKEALDIAFRKHGIDLDTAIAPIGKALKATKVQITGQGDQAFAEVVEDIDLQLKGSDRALKLMGIGKDEGSSTYNFTQIINEKGDKYAD